MDDKKRRLEENYIKVSHNEYLSKDDPKFLEKYLKYFPEDGEKCYEYAKQLEQQKGKEKRSIYFYKKALAAGYLSAAQDIKNITERKNNPKATESDATSKDTKKQLLLLGLVNFVFFTVLTLSILTYLLYQNDMMVFAEHKDENLSTKDIYALSGEKCGEDGQPLLLEEENIENLPTDLLIVNSAIQRYYQLNNAYPSSLQKLGETGQFLTSIPSHIGYVTNGNTYFISIEKKIYKGSPIPINLVHYPDVNQLAVQYGEKILAVYPVASAENNTIPFTQSNVTKKVVNPNGGYGSLGTRGLVLHDQFAIHGTDDPESIGQYVTAGCIRMFNKDIEALFPYISIGTDIIVKEGKPTSTPLYSNGLPEKIESPLTLQKLESREFYTWKN